MKWTLSDRNNMVKALEKPFEFERERSKKSIEREKSCYDPNVLLKLIRPQIIEIINQDLPYLTPEDWDKSFETLGGGRHRRKSKAILQIMNWDQFLEKFKEVEESIR